MLRVPPGGESGETPILTSRVGGKKKRSSEDIVYELLVLEKEKGGNHRAREKRKGKGPAC